MAINIDPVPSFAPHTRYAQIITYGVCAATGAAAAAAMPIYNIKYL